MQRSTTFLVHLPKPFKLALKAGFEEKGHHLGLITYCGTVKSTARCECCAQVCAVLQQVLYCVLLAHLCCPVNRALSICISLVRVGLCLKQRVDYAVKAALSSSNRENKRCPAFLPFFGQVWVAGLCFELIGEVENRNGKFLVFFSYQMVQQAKPSFVKRVEVDLLVAKYI